jgi:oxygen-independent coproporphyrinogen-3 oxidase
MFVIDLAQGNLEYDVHALTGSFFPGEEVHVLTPETGEDKRKVWEPAVQMKIRFAGEGTQGTVQWKDQVFHWQYCGIEYGLSVTEKESFKRFFYKVLSQVTAKELPWGSLTGIRPTKLCYQMLEEGESDDEIVRFMQRKYDVSLGKAKLGLDIAKRERRLLSGMNGAGGESYSLYVGIPFCPTTCLYCSFTSYPIAKYRDKVDCYLDCLLEEGQAIYGMLKQAPKTVFIGGGTPTSLEAGQLERLLGGLQEIYGDFSSIEFTVEAGRADSITHEKLEVLKRLGVNRISVNPQTMNRETLHRIGRQHTTEQVKEAYKAARETGFTNINMDIILGLPGEGEQEVRHTIDEIVALAPDSLTVHSLAVKRASRMKEWLKEHGSEELHNSDTMMKIAEAGATQLGMEPYYLYRQKNMAGNFENVGYAAPGKEGLYNILIMEEKQTIVALGAGSISKKVCTDGRIERRENVKDVDMYCSQLSEMIGRKREILAEKRRNK